MEVARLPQAVFYQHNIYQHNLQRIIYPFTTGCVSFKMLAQILEVTKKLPKKIPGWKITSEQRGAMKSRWSSICNKLVEWTACKDQQFALCLQCKRMLKSEQIGLFKCPIQALQIGMSQFNTMNPMMIQGLNHGLDLFKEVYRKASFGCQDWKHANDDYLIINRQRVSGFIEDLDRELLGKYEETVPLINKKEEEQLIEREPEFVTAQGSLRSGQAKQQAGSCYSIKMEAGGSYPIKKEVSDNGMGINGRKRSKNE